MPGAVSDTRNIVKNKNENPALTEIEGVGQ